MTLLTVAQVAERLGTTERHVRGLLYRNELGRIKVGRLVRVSEPQLTAYVRRRTVDAA